MKQKLYKILSVVSLSLAVMVFAGEVFAQATWAEPDCNPSDDPTICNISAPINVSDSDQTKTGGLSINGTLEATSSFQYTGATGSFSVTPDSITDSMVEDDLTANIFIRDGDYSSPGYQAVNLGSWNTVFTSSDEVTGMLDAAAIEPTSEYWVNETGDTMTGQLSIQPPDTALDITHSTANTSHAIDIYVSSSVDDGNSLTGAKALYIESDSPDINAIPIYVDVNGSAKTGIYVETNASNSTGIYVNQSGVNAPGIYVAADDNGVESYSSSAAGVRGETNSAYQAGVIGYTGAASSYGILGESAQAEGVYGNTYNGSGAYGTVGCANNANCGRWGGSEYAGLFDNGTLTFGRVIGNDFLPTDDETYGLYSYAAGANLGSIKLSGVDWGDVTLFASDGSELWVHHNHSSNPAHWRIDGSTMQENINRPFGSAGYTGATLAPKGLVAVHDSDGEVCEWEKRADRFQCPYGAGDPGFIDGTRAGIVKLYFDGKYFWGGKDVSKGMVRFDADYSNNVATPATAGWGPNSKIRDIILADNDIYYIEDRDPVTNESRIVKLDRNGNSIIRDWTFTSYDLDSLVFDGKYLWASASDGPVSAGGVFQGLMRIDVETEVTDKFDFNSSYPTDFDSPTDMVFDGTYIWVLLKGSSKAARVSPFIKDGASLAVVNDEFIDFAIPPHMITYDGNSIFIIGDNGTAGSTKIYKLAAGKGYGQDWSGVLPREGISLWDYNTGNGACIRVESGTLAVYTGALCN